MPESVDMAVIDQKLKDKKPLTKDETTAYLKADSDSPEGYKSRMVSIPIPDDVKVVDEKPAEPLPLPAEIAKPVNEDPFVKLERELAKDEGKEDLSQFSDREKAYYYQMRRDRKQRQKAEEDRDAALFREAKAKQDAKAKQENISQGKEDSEEVLKGKDPTDFVTVADLKEINKPRPVEEPVNQPAKSDVIQQRYLDFCEKEAQGKHDDYEAVMLLSDDILRTNPSYIDQIQSALIKGDNPAERAYSLIKSDPEFAKLFPVAQTKVEARKKKEESAAAAQKADQEKEAKAKQAEAQLESNQTRPKTTGHVAAVEDKPTSEFAFNDYAGMSDRDFAKLPKRERERVLRQMQGL